MRVLWGYVMKKTSSLLWVALAAGLLVVPSLRAADEPKPEAQSAVTEDLGYDFYDGKSNKIARVFNATPVAVQVIYEGNKGSRNIPRDNLPPQLKAKYPYDADAAAQFMKNQALKVEAQHDVQRQAWEKRETELKAKLASLKRQSTDKKHEIAIVNEHIHAEPRNRDLRAKKADLLQQQEDLRKQTETAEDQLAQARKALNSLP